MRVDMGSPVLYAMPAAMLTGLPPYCPYFCASHRIAEKRTIEVLMGSVVVMARDSYSLMRTLARLQLRNVNSSPAEVRVGT
jgi:hypothetical protein